MTKNFSLSEFQCRCGCVMPDDVLENIKELANNLQIIRDMLCEPIKVTSGFRCEKYNRKIKGVKKSQHLLGKASDLQVKNTTPDEVANAIDKLQQGGFIKKGGLGRYNSFTHYDIRGRNAYWDKRK
ncbi:MAG: putative peptidase M15 [Prokaryotic dsDNA virus sp.]|jgi:uncharacterized protein YcbK (DUF882 family)|nr:MAG: putative peptidase M15 [Prokaryotic dsDNA virus sp.]|tara:strand:+ start:8281 stop:8658 length:378 start_codon:yes stop_codon:yes gene_type:complete